MKELLNSAQAAGAKIVSLLGDTYAIIPDPRGARAPNSGPGSYSLVQGCFRPGTLWRRRCNNDASATYYLLEGEVDFDLDDEEIPARTGELIQVPRGTLHDFCVTGTGNCRILIHSIPAGLGDFLLAAGRPVSGLDQFLDPEPGELERVRALAEKHGITLFD